MSKDQVNVTTSFERQLNMRRNWALAGSGLLIVVGLATLVFALYRFLYEGRGIGLVVPGCSLMAAGVASGVATLGVVSWAEHRERDRETKEYEHREKVYEEITQFMVARFLGEGYDKTKDGQLRAMAALWASPKVVESLANWQQDLTGVLDRSPSGLMNPIDSDRVKRNLGTAVTAMRKDLGSTSSHVDPVVILRSIFNETISDDLYREESAGTVLA